MNNQIKKLMEGHRAYHESKGHQLASYEETHIGQLVSGIHSNGGGYGGYGKVHWFNHRGCFIGSDQGFVEWGNIYLHHNGKVFLQIRHGYPEWVGGFMQWKHEMTCKLATVLMKMAYID